MMSNTEHRNLNKGIRVIGKNNSNNITLTRKYLPDIYHIYQYLPFF